MTDAPKTKSIGTISADTAKKVSGFSDYTKAAAALSEARRPTQDAKAQGNAALKRSELCIVGNLSGAVVCNSPEEPATP